MKAIACVSLMALCFAGCAGQQNASNGRPASTSVSSEAGPTANSRAFTVANDTDCSGEETTLVQYYQLKGDHAPIAGTWFVVTYRPHLPVDQRSRMLFYANGAYLTQVDSTAGEATAVWLRYPGGDLQYSFQRCVGGDYYDYAETRREQFGSETPPQAWIVDSGSEVRALIEWNREPPQIPQPQIVFRVNAPQQCGGIPGVFRVATNYAHVSTGGPNGQPRPVRHLSVTMNYDHDFRPVHNEASNSNFVEASEQIRNVGPTVDACTPYHVTGEATLDDGTVLRKTVASYRR